MKKYYYNINISIPNDTRNISINLNTSKDDLCHYEKHEETDLKKLDDDICLGSRVTEEQSASIANGSFNGLHIGSYWTIITTNFRIMAHDQFYGYNGINKHHVVVMPDTIYSLQKYNNSSTNDGGYTSSILMNYIIDFYDPVIVSLFGYNHVLPHTHDLTDGTADNGKLMRVAKTIAWLINSYNVNGTKYSRETSYNWQEADKTQFPAFKNDTSLKISNYYGHTYCWWLGSSSSDTSTCFCHVTSSGAVSSGIASNSLGVRPAFLVY